MMSFSHASAITERFLLISKNKKTHNLKSIASCQLVPSEQGVITSKIRNLTLIAIFTLTYTCLSFFKKPYIKGHFLIFGCEVLLLCMCHISQKRRHVRSLW